LIYQHINAVSKCIYEKKNGFTNYIIDIDSFKVGTLQHKDLEFIVTKLHDNLIEEFHKNVTENLLEHLRSDN